MSIASTLSHAQGMRGNVTSNCGVAGRGAAAARGAVGAGLGATRQGPEAAAEARGAGGGRRRDASCSSRAAKGAAARGSGTAELHSAAAVQRGGGTAGAAQRVSAAHVDLQHLAPARVHAKFVHGCDACEEPCGSGCGRGGAAGTTARLPAPCCSAGGGCLVAPLPACSRMLPPARPVLPYSKARHSRSSEKNSSAMKSEATMVIAPPAEVRLKNSAASSRCEQQSGGAPAG